MLGLSDKQMPEIRSAVKIVVNASDKALSTIDSAALAAAPTDHLKGGTGR
jgi:hypothetical protein